MRLQLTAITLLAVITICPLRAGEVPASRQTDAEGLL
jgi:hypothetical protein